MGAPRPFGAVLGCLSVVALSWMCCARRNVVQLDYGDPAQPTGGLACRDRAGVPLRARGLHDGGYGLSIVVDFIELGGVPGCWPGELLGWCARDAGSCAPLSSRRLCLEIAVDGGDPTALSAELGKRLKNESITNDAPDEPVLIRLVATAQGCDQLRQVTQPFADQSLIGCMISCPVQLDTVQKVALGLPTFTDDCEQAVQVCAAPRLGRP